MAVSLDIKVWVVDGVTVHHHHKGILMEVCEVAQFDLLYHMVVVGETGAVAVVLVLDTITLVEVAHQ